MHFNSVLIKCRFPWLRSGPLDARGPPVTQTSPRWIWAVFNCALVLFSQTVWRGFTQKVCQLKDRRVQTTPQDFKCSASLKGGISRQVVEHLNKRLKSVCFANEMRVMANSKWRDSHYSSPDWSFPRLAPSLSPPSINVMSKSWPLGRDVERKIGPIMCQGVWKEQRRCLSTLTPNCPWS